MMIRMHELRPYSIAATDLFVTRVCRDAQQVVERFVRDPRRRGVFGGFAVRGFLGARWNRVWRPGGGPALELGVHALAERLVDDGRRIAHAAHQVVVTVPSGNGDPI